MRFDKFFFLLLQTFAYYTSDSSLPVFHSYLSIVSPKIFLNKFEQFKRYFKRAKKNMRENVS